jgi:TonB family protein
VNKRLVLVSILCLLTPSWFTRVAAQRNQSVVDKDSRVVDFEELRYPPLARAARIQGIVVIRVTLDDTGGVKDAEAISGAELLVSDCLTNVKKWRFQPNLQKTAVIVYHFKMPGVSCKSVGSFFMLQGPNFATIVGCEVPVETVQNPTRR